MKGPGLGRRQQVAAPLLGPGRGVFRGGCGGGTETRVSGTFCYESESHRRDPNSAAAQWRSLSRANHCSVIRGVRGFPLSFDFETDYVMHGPSSISKFPAFLKILYPISVIRHAIKSHGHAFIFICTPVDPALTYACLRPARLSRAPDAPARRARGARPTGRSPRVSAPGHGHLGLRERARGGR